MNYSESPKILEKIKQSKNVLINCHRNPDMDSVGSALAFSLILEKMGIKTKLICPTGVSNYYDFLPKIEKINKIDFRNFDFGKYDLFIILDSGGIEMVTNDKNIPIPEIPVVIIDHHKTNNLKGVVELIDSNKSSTAEIIYGLVEDWGVKISKETATSLFAGMVEDSGGFRFPGVTAKTHKIASELLAIGADSRLVYENVFSVDPGMLKFWGEIISGFEFDFRLKYAYCAIKNERFKELGSLANGTGSAATQFGSLIRGIDVSIIIVETNKNEIAVSFRSREGTVDVSKIAEIMGGGGHFSASGVNLKGYNFDEGVKHIIGVVKKCLEK